MLQEVDDGEKTAILSKEMLSRYVRAEFEVFLIFLKLIISSCLSISMGNPFSMGLHDGGTLANKKKFQALALQFIAPQWKKNLCVTVGLKRSAHTTRMRTSLRCGARRCASARAKKVMRL